MPLQVKKKTFRSLFVAPRVFASSFLHVSPLFLPFVCFIALFCFHQTIFNVSLFRRPVGRSPSQPPDPQIDAIFFSIRSAVLFVHGGSDWPLEKKLHGGRSVDLGQENVNLKKR